MPVLTQLNSGTMYLICGTIVLFVAAVCAVFIVRAWRAGKALGMDTARMKRAMTASATFTVLPSIGILLGVIALSGSLGIPWPWLRLSVIGALHYETQVAQAAAEQLGLQLSGETMTAGAFSTIALLMSVCIMWGMILMTVLGKKYLTRLAGKPRPNTEKKNPGFADAAMTSKPTAVASDCVLTDFNATMSSENELFSLLNKEIGPVPAISINLFSAGPIPVPVAIWFLNSFSPCRMPIKVVIF